MKLGLVRHFQIPHNRVQMVNGGGFLDWAEWYDTTEVKARLVPEAGTSWDLCLCSDLPRAMFTAKTLYKGPIEFTPMLREVPFSPFLPRNLKVPLFVWQATSRVGWYLDHKSQSENRTQTKQRIVEFVESLRSKYRDRNVLIVSHGFFMQFLEKELVKHGFKGKVPTRPHGGTIYPFES